MYLNYLGSLDDGCDGIEKIIANWVPVAHACNSIYLGR
jgi:hypothetical protein